MTRFCCTTRPPAFCLCFFLFVFFLFNILLVTSCSDGLSHFFANSPVSPVLNLALIFFVILFFFFFSLSSSSFFSCSFPIVSNCYSYQAFPSFRPTFIAFHLRWLTNTVWPVARACKSHFFRTIVSLWVFFADLFGLLTSGQPSFCICCLSSVLLLGHSVCVCVCLLNWPIGSRFSPSRTLGTSADTRKRKSFCCPATIATFKGCFNRRFSSSPLLSLLARRLTFGWSTDADLFHSRSLVFCLSLSLTHTQFCEFKRSLSKRSWSMRILFINSSDHSSLPPSFLLLMISRSILWLFIDCLTFDRMFESFSDTNVEVLPKCHCRCHVLFRHFFPFFWMSFAFQTRDIWSKHTLTHVKEQKTLKKCFPVQLCVLTQICVFTLNTKNHTFLFFNFPLADHPIDLPAVQLSPLFAFLFFICLDSCASSAFVRPRIQVVALCFILSLLCHTFVTFLFITLRMSFHSKTVFCLPFYS